MKLKQIIWTELSKANEVIRRAIERESGYSSEIFESLKMVGNNRVISCYYDESRKLDAFYQLGFVEEKGNIALHFQFNLAIAEKILETKSVDVAIRTLSTYTQKEFFDFLAMFKLKIANNIIVKEKIKMVENLKGEIEKLKNEIMETGLEVA